eukprot:TRINITY_DN6931_c0_g1_i2.p1 TRINITY_DN6931_c0_g1~~TRINITY_DN6931_c0_g1_i2.p1  ORF type:complete len:1087 (+),score=226.89 TRINITY_DN6931_c0_g1_i2:260-3520(+)
MIQRSPTAGRAARPRRLRRFLTFCHASLAHQPTLLYRRTVSKGMLVLSKESLRLGWQLPCPRFFPSMLPTAVSGVAQQASAPAQVPESMEDDDHDSDALAEFLRIDEEDGSDASGSERGRRSPFSPFGISPEFAAAESARSLFGLASQALRIIIDHARRRDELQAPREVPPVPEPSALTQIPAATKQRRLHQRSSLSHAVFGSRSTPAEEPLRQPPTGPQASVLTALGVNPLLGLTEELLAMSERRETSAETSEARHMELNHVRARLTVSQWQICAELLGSCPGSASSDLERAFLMRQPKQSPAQHAGAALFEAFFRLSSRFRAPRQNPALFRDLLQTVQQFYRMIDAQFDFNGSAIEEEEDSLDDLKHCFFVCGGVDQLLEIVTLMRARPISAGSLADASVISTAKKELMHLIRELVQSSGLICSHVASRVEFFRAVFQEMVHSLHPPDLDGSYLSALIRVCEEVLQYRFQVIPLQDLLSVAELCTLCLNMGVNDLFPMLRMLTQFIHDNDSKPQDPMKPVPLVAPVGERAGPAAPTGSAGPSQRLSTPAEVISKRGNVENIKNAQNIDRNHAFLHACGPLLSRVVDLLRIHNTQPFEEEATEILQRLLREGDNAPPVSIATLLDLLHATAKAETLFFISCLLNGRRRFDFQSLFIRRGLVRTLCGVWAALKWEKVPAQDDHPPIAIHGPGCECHPENYFRLQYLRVVHYMCDSAPSNKLLFLSTSERAGVLAKVQARLAREVEPESVGGADTRRPRDAEARPALRRKKHQHRDGQGVAAPLSPSVQAKSADTALFETPHSLETFGCGDCPAGIIARILGLLVTLPQDSKYRFWLGSCCDSFMRGSPLEFRLFLSEKGLLNWLLSQVLSEGFTVANTLQTNFDLLGELIRWNEPIFSEISVLLTEDGFARLKAVIQSHLVDSNVFLRALVLSLERFRETELGGAVQVRGVEEGIDTEHSWGSVFPFREHPMWMRLQEIRLSLLAELMQAVSMEDLNQENVCCLNTALLFFLFYRRQRALPRVLAELGRTHAAALENFKALLGFWKQFYALQGRDCNTLELTTEISLREWHETWAELTTLLNSQAT